MKRFWMIVAMVVLLLGLFTVSASSESGTFDGIGWDLTDGVLTLGEEGETQTLEDKSRNAHSWPWRDSESSITSVVTKGNLILKGSLNGMFDGRKDIVSIDVTGWNTSAVTNMSYMFYNCSGLTSLDLSSFDTSAVINMNAMFYGCWGLTNINLSGWDVHNVGIMQSMFYGCARLEQLDLSAWDVSSLRTAKEMFAKCTSLASINLSGWAPQPSSGCGMSSMFDGCTQLSTVTMTNCDTSHVIDFSRFFVGCTSLTEFNAASMDTSSATSLKSMFHSCSNLVAIDISMWDTSSVIDMGSLFLNCAALTECNVAGLDTSSVQDMSYLFRNSGVQSLDVSEWDVSNVKNMSHMFRDCPNLSFLDLSSWNTQSVTNLAYMFYDCVNLEVLNLSGWNVGNVTTLEHFCDTDRKLKSLDVANWNTSQMINMTSAFAQCNALEFLDVSGWDVSSTTSIESMFSGCHVLTVLDVSDWNTSNVTKLAGVFSNCRSVLEIDVSGWDTSKATSFSSMFSVCQSVITLDVSHFNTSNVTSMYSMFSGCSSLASIDVSSFDTSNVTTMENMFARCASLDSLDVSDFNTQNVTTFSSMFAGVGVKELYLDNFDTHSATSMSGMFAECSNLVVCDVSSFDTSNVTTMSNMFRNCLKLSFLDLSAFDTRQATGMYSMYELLPNLDTIILGDYNPFVGNGVNCPLPSHTTERDGVSYTGKWIRDDNTAGPYSSEELRDNYNSSMAGTWVWEKVQTEYSITFVCTEDGHVGEMPPVTVVASEDYELPGNEFFVFGKAFDHWTDGTRRVYQDRDVIPANTYSANTVVTLTAVFVPRNTSIQMQDGEFTFSIKGDEKAFFDSVPAGTSYSVFEENIPEDWVLIMQSDSTGVITSLKESEALFLNKYQPDMATMQFTGRKLMDGQPAEKDSFTFELWENDVLLQTKSVKEGGFVQFDILEYTRTDAGIHTYVIKELAGTDSALLYDGHEETIAVEVTTEEGSDNVTRVHAEVTYSDGTYPDIVFQNWTKPGELTLKKLVDDLLAGHEGNEFRFRIVFKQDNGLPLEDELTYSIMDP